MFYCMFYFTCDRSFTEPRVSCAETQALLFCRCRLFLFFQRLISEVDHSIVTKL